MLCTEGIEMKPGDLVTLSSYGKKVKRTGWIKDGDIGIVKAVRGVSPWGTFRVFWCNSTIKHGAKRDYTPRGSSWDWSFTFDRKDLKFVKRSK